MADGGEDSATSIKSMSSVSEGLGLIRNIIIDTHFGARGSTGRLMAMQAAHPHVISIGLDEDTAAIVDSELVMSVIGSGAVTIVDGSAIRTDIELIGAEEPIMISEVELHTVTEQYQFDIRARRFRFAIAIALHAEDRAAMASYRRLNQLLRKQGSGRKAS